MSPLFPNTVFSKGFWWLSILLLTLKGREDIVLPVLWTHWFPCRMKVDHFHPITPLSRPLQLLSTPSSFNTIIVSGVNGCCVLVTSARDYCCCTVLKKITCFDSQHAAPHQISWLHFQRPFCPWNRFPLCVCVWTGRLNTRVGKRRKCVCISSKCKQTIVTIETGGGVEKHKVFI